MGSATMMGRTEKAHGNRTDWYNIRQMMPFVWAYKGRVLLALICLVISKLAMVGIPIVLKYIVDALDTDAGQVGSGIAVILEIPCITAACKVEPGAGKVIVERVVSDGTEEVEAPLPALVTVSSEIGELRYPGVKELMAAQKTPITVRKAQELGVEVSKLKSLNLVSMAAPPGRKAECQYIEAETPEEAGADLAIKVREAQLL